MIRITNEFVEQNPDAYLNLGQERMAPVTGWHFGSRFPGDPSRNIVYDFLPDSLLERVENLAEFRGALVFDKWTGNADARQAVFFRAKVTEGPSSQSPPSPRLGFVAQMVDNGYVFEGPHWRLKDSPLQGVYFRPVVYRSVRGFKDFEPWLERIIHFPEEVVDHALKQIPPAWLEEDRYELEQLLDGLLRRRQRVPDLIEACRAGRVDPFPNWRR